MDRNNITTTQPWKSIVALVMVAGGCICFILSAVCAMIVASNKQ